MRIGIVYTDCLDDFPVSGDDPDVIGLVKFEDKPNLDDIMKVIEKCDDSKEVKEHLVDGNPVLVYDGEITWEINSSMKLEFGEIGKAPIDESLPPPPPLSDDFLITRLSNMALHNAHIDFNILRSGLAKAGIAAPESDEELGQRAPSLARRAINRLENMQL